ncbi:interferon phi 4 [Hoplias malabaricus]|uniref:interferon phi 4 n=1 Tax=Hoplias malabaricus TaxID=27720 RepID=UPI003463427E
MSTCSTSQQDATLDNTDTREETTPLRDFLKPEWFGHEDMTEEDAGRLGNYPRASREERLCLILVLCSLSSGFSCRWISNKFRQYHGKCLMLLREMDTGVRVDGGDDAIFDVDWFVHHTQSRPEKQVWFVIQTLEEISLLLNEAESVSWSREKLQNFLNIIDHETERLRSCVTSRFRENKRLKDHFQALRDLTQNKTSDQSYAWEQTRKELLRILNLLELFPALSAH